MPRTKRYRDQEWALELGDEEVRVLNQKDAVVVEFPRAEAVGRFQLPSFWDSVKYFGITVSDGEIERFDVSPKGMEMIKEYLENVTIDAGPDAIRSYLRSGLVMVVIGLALATVGIVGSIMSYNEAAANPEGGSYRISWGMVLFGIASLCKGGYNLYYYANLSVNVRAPEEDTD